MSEIKDWQDAEMRFWEVKARLSFLCTGLLQQENQWDEEGLMGLSTILHDVKRDIEGLEKWLSDIGFNRLPEKKEN